MTTKRSPASTCCVAPIASRSTTPGDGRGDGRLHLHRLDRGDRLAGRDGVAHVGLERHDARERRGHLAGLGRVGLLGLAHVDLDAAVPHEHGSQLSVQRGHDGAHALVVGRADRLEPDEQAHAALDLDDVLGARRQPVEVVDGVEHRQVAEGLAHRLEGLRGRGEEQPVEGSAPRRGVAGETGGVGIRQRSDADLDVAARRAPWCGTARAIRPAGRRARRP